MILNIDSFRYFGISVKGPRHAREKKPNQDAWLGNAGRNSLFVVVCDGLGSRSQSGTGARSACLATSNAIQIWAKSQDDRVENLLRLIKQLWELRLAPNLLQEFATTCLFAAILPRQGLLVAGLGDGTAIVAQPDQALETILARSNNFSNQTIALGTPHKLSDWSYKLYPQPQVGTIALLATDGVADDLRPDKLAELPAWLLDTYGTMSATERYFALRHELKNWSTPGHQDDKTIALLYRKTL